LDNERLQGGRVDGVTLVEIDGTNRLAVQTRVEEPFRILQLGPFWKRQPHGVLEGLAYADDAVVGPDGNPLGAGRLLPLHLFDYAGVGAPDQSPQLAEPLASPAGGLPDDGIDLSGRGCVVLPQYDRLLQLAAFFTSAAILASTAAVNPVRAKAVGHMAPSSRFALS